MAPKSSSVDDSRSALRDLLGRGEEVVGVFLEELTGSTSLRQELEKTVRRATMARKTVDKNVEAMLGALNLPTRSDYRRLMTELQAVQGGIVNLNMKLDRLLASQTAARPATPPAPVVPVAPVTTKPRSSAKRKKVAAAAKRPSRRRRTD